MAVTSLFWIPGRSRGQAFPTGGFALDWGGRQFKMQSERMERGLTAMTPRGDHQDFLEKEGIWTTEGVHRLCRFAPRQVQPLQNQHQFRGR